MFTEAYRGGKVDARSAEGLSYYGLCLALVEKKYKQAIEWCKLAIEQQFYHPAHYLNLAKVYLAQSNRKKAVEALDAGLKIHPEDEELLSARKEMGVRARPPVPFLDRAHPVNQSLGRARHAVSTKKPAKKS
jgi:tetratricopeptide (TPR) repeat protein